MIKTNFFGKECIIDRALLERKNLLENLTKARFIFDDILLMSQVHGAEVVVIDDIKKIYGTENLPKADAIITNIPNLVIGIVTADCGPILFYDEENKIIGAAHAGWRGARLDVIDATILAMKKLGAKNIKVKIGPMIQQNSYEISQEFFDDFLSEDAANKEFFINAKNIGKYYFDLPAYIEKKLKIAQIKEIENLGIDTYKNEEKFFSFRRANHQGLTDCGRNLSVIAIN